VSAEVATGIPTLWTGVGGIHVCEHHHVDLMPLHEEQDPGLREYSPMYLEASGLAAYQPMNLGTRTPEHHHLPRSTTASESPG
jgi:hypothetical protein